MSGHTSVANHRTPESNGTNVTSLQNISREQRDQASGVRVCSPYLALGVTLAVLFVGIGLTAASLTYPDTDNLLTKVAPVCLVAGLIATGRLIYRKCCLIYRKFKLLNQSNQCSADTTHSAIASQTQVVEMTSTTDIGHRQRQLEEDEQAIYLEPTSPDSQCPYSDDPPSYAQVADGGRNQLQRQRRVTEPLRFGAMVNPALEDDGQDHPGVGGVDAPQTNPRCSTPTTRDQLPPPPPYEECKHITQTSL